MALPAEGWTDAPVRANVTPFHLPEAESFSYHDPAPLASVGAAIAVQGRTIGLVTVDGNRGTSADGEGSIRARLMVSGVYSVVMLDSLSVPAAIVQCPLPAASSFSQCETPAGGAWEACD